MSDQTTRATTFANLHVKGDPIIIYNAWDGGVARAVAEAGAKAIATGDHPVGFAHGFTNDNFDDFTFDIYLRTIKEIIGCIDLPFSADISNGQGLDLDGLKERIKILLEAGVVGINFEDRLDDSSGVKPIEEQVERLKAIRAAADDFGVPLFINARTDLFTTIGKDGPASVLDEAVERAKAYKEAGGNGFFAPGLMDVGLVKQLCDQVELPVNIIRLPGAPSTKELTEAGVGRISYGPIPQMEMIEWLKQKARAALNGEV